MRGFVSGMQNRYGINKSTNYLITENEIDIVLKDKCW